jgi:NAD(P)-dependent dehydrogenase (short-subunit alcohol dehydrogenase family)
MVITMRFSGKVALVSGAGSGIGKAIAEAFSREGGRVILLGRTLSKLEKAAAGLPGPGSLAVSAHQENPGEVALALERAMKAMGRLDILVNNAGIYTPGAAGEIPFEAWEESLAVNLTGPYLLTREALPHLRRDRKGVIVNVASTLGLKPIPGAAAYSTAKAGLIMLTRATALEEARNGVRANAVCPGVVDTPIHRQRVGDDPGRKEAFLQEAAQLHPVGRVGNPEEIASLVLFLASEAASWITGAVVTIDGGISLT